LAIETILIILLAFLSVFVKALMEMDGESDSSINAMFLTHFLIVIDFFVFKNPRAFLLEDLYKYFLKLFK
jgi:hypothetical protein